MKEVNLKFYSTEEKLPLRSGYYIGVQIVFGEYICRELHYSARYKLFNVYDTNRNLNFISKYAIKVDYWAEMPKFWEGQDE